MGVSDLQNLVVWFLFFSAVVHFISALIFGIKWAQISNLDTRLSRLHESFRDDQKTNQSMFRELEKAVSTLEGQQSRKENHACIHG